MGKKKNKHSKNKTSANKKLPDGSIFEINENPDDLGSSKSGTFNKIDECALNNKINILVDNSMKKDIEHSFETYYPNNRRVTGREHYVHSLCQVCKEDPLERVPCPKCQFVSYCNQEHRREHWPVHADLCAAIQAVCVDRGANHIMHGAANLTPDKFRKFRFQNMVECESKAERPLEKWEKEMFIFPNVCGTCYEHNLQKIVACDRCLHSSFCKGHQTENHGNWCEYLIRYKNIVKSQVKFGVVCPSIPICKISLSSPKLLGMRQFFINISNDIDEFEFLELTEISTYPLTTLYAIQEMNKNNLLNSKRLELHVVGAEPDFETNRLEKWEYYILHLIPELQSLQIEFFGPELNTFLQPESYKVCSHCAAAKKSISFGFHNQLYHTFSDKPSFSKPNLICVFNPGLYRTTGFNSEDTWSPTITTMCSKNCPLLTTAYTKNEILLDVKRVKLIQNVRLEIEPAENPFSSLKPSLNFVSEEDSPIIFKNQFYCVMSKS